MPDRELLLIDAPRPGVRRLTMNRPEKRNALNNELRGAILAALQAADGDPGVKVSILRGAGPAFSAFQQINKRSVHRAMEIMGLRAAIRSGTELQALAFTTEPSQAYRRGFKRDGASVRAQLTRRDAPFKDYRERT